MFKNAAKHIKTTSSHGCTDLLNKLLTDLIESNKSDLNWQQNHNQSPHAVAGLEKGLSQDADWLSDETVKEALRHAEQVALPSQRSRCIKLRLKKATFISLQFKIDHSVCANCHCNWYAVTIGLSTTVHRKSPFSPLIEFQLCFLYMVLCFSPQH